MTFTKPLRIGLLALLAAHMITANATPTDSLTPDAAQFIRLTQALEADPLQDNAKAIRRWLLNWTNDSKTVTVTVCNIFGPLLEQELPYGPELLVQSMFGNAAFQITHPDQKTTQALTQVAGLESLLKAYESILTTHPEAHIPYYDDLLKQRNAGTLAAFMSSIIAKSCDKHAH